MSGFAIGASEGDADDTDEAPARFTLRVYVHGARGLAATGKVLPCNAYAEVSYGRQYVGRTRSSGGTQPRWAASLAVTLAAPPAASPRRAVSVDVYDHVPGMNRHCDTFLGRANIEAASLDAPLGTAPRRWHALVGGPPSKGRGKSGEVDCEVRFEGCGESCAEAEQAPPGVLLRVNLTIVRARGLVCKDYCGTSDPYVIVTGAKGFFAYGKTKTLFMTLKPEWHETFAIRPREDSMGTVAMPSDIFLRIMDYDALTRDDAMGGLECAHRAIMQRPRQSRESAPFVRRRYAAGSTSTTSSAILHRSSRGGGTTSARIRTASTPRARSSSTCALSSSRRPRPRRARSKRRSDPSSSPPSSSRPSDPLLHARVFLRSLRGALRRGWTRG